MAFCPDCCARWGQVLSGEVSRCADCLSGSGPIGRLAVDVSGLTAAVMSMSDAIDLAAAELQAFRAPATIVASGTFMAPQTVTPAEYAAETRRCVCGHLEAAHAPTGCWGCGCDLFVLREAANLVERGAPLRIDPDGAFHAIATDTGERIALRDLARARQRYTDAAVAAAKFDPPPVRRPLALAGLLKARKA